MKKFSPLLNRKPLKFIATSWPTRGSWKVLNTAQVSRKKGKQYNEGILFLHSKLLLGAFGVLYYRWQSKAFAENVVTHTCTESEFWTPLYMFRYLYQQEPRQMMLQKITQIVQSNPSVSHSTEPLFVQIAKCICPDCKMYLFKLLNVLCQSDPSVSHSTQSLGPAHTPRGLKSNIWRTKFTQYVTIYDTMDHT